MRARQPPQVAPSADEDNVLYFVPMAAGVFIAMALAEKFLRHDGEWKPIIYGGVAFLLAWAFHLHYADAMRSMLGLEGTADAFASFSGLVGLVFSLQLGQTCGTHSACAHILPAHAPTRGRWQVPILL